MTKTLKYLLLSLFLVTLLGILFICSIKLEIATMCQLLMSNENKDISVNHKLHKYLKEQKIHKCSIEYNEYYFYGYLQYKEKHDTNYFYSVSLESTLSLENGVYLMNVHFSSLTIIKYLYYFGIN